MSDDHRLTKSHDRWIAGVCGGLAEYFGFEKDLLRICWILLTFFTAAFPGIIAYIILWILMPQKVQND